MDLNVLLASPEGKTLEFKRDISSPEGIIRSVVAFANTAGGTIIIGVEDRTRRVRGIADPVLVAEQAANLISTLVAPRVVPEIEVCPWRKTHLVTITVHPAWTGPHHFTRLGPKEGVFVRVGASNRVADAPLIAQIERLARNESYDEQPLPELSSEEIDVDAATALFKPVRRLDKQDLFTLRVLTRHHGRVVPTVGGILLFGKARLNHFPDAYIKAGLFDGTDRRRILDSTDFQSSLPTAVDDVLAFVRKQVRREIVIGQTRSARHTEKWSVPETAVREAIVNAVVHADYAQRGSPIRVAIFDDRIEIDSPGLLIPGLTLDDLWRGVSKLRNPVLGRVFHELALIENWGSGIKRMRAECEQAGLPDPVLEEIGTQFRVTLPSIPNRSPTLSTVDEKIVAWLRETGGASTRQVAAQFAISQRSARLRLAALSARKILSEIGSSPTDPQRRYIVTKSGRS
jgi:predicted HTH transcriptional regulator